jgi:hypothetical protein
MKKGDLVRVTAHFGGITPITPKRLAEWYERYKGNMIDAGGEPRLSPRHEWVDFEAGKVLIVSKAKVHPKRAEFLDTETGMRVEVDNREWRDRIEVVSGQ